MPTLKTKWDGYTCCLQPTIPNTNEKCNCRQTKSHPRGPILNESTQWRFALIVAQRATSESETMRQGLPSVDCFSKSISWTKWLVTHLDSIPSNHSLRPCERI